jgi:hypothetical protein
MKKPSHNKQKESNENAIDFESLKRQLDETDFDGHTAFNSMTFTQKLEWLSEAAESVYILKKGRKTSPGN